MDRKLIVTFTLLIFLFLSACGGSGDDAQSLTKEEIRATAENVAGTMVAMTSAARPATATNTPTFVASETPEPTATVVPTEPASRLTTIQKMNCRNGPGTEYMILVQMEESASLRIMGRNANITWWYVEPEELDEGCWLFGDLVIVPAELEEIPVVESSALPLIGNDPRYILYYLIAEDSGGTVACEDSLVAINTGVLRTDNPAEDVKIAMRALFSIGSPYVSGYRHSGYQSHLEVVSSEYNIGTQVANVYLSGTVIKPEDNCDKERFRVQIFATAQQFTGIVKAYVWVGSTPIGDFLVQTK